ncbi:hypothetical protein B0O80DRAFT_487446 [Mortierella sp. GBAus27b]|nr:hypothetical protein B0O80DRAFT_487446 [Mortierella sp. GBAus27b]
MDTTLYGGDARWTTVRQGTAEQCRTLWLERKDAGGQVEWRGGKGDSDAEEGVACTLYTSSSACLFHFCLARSPMDYHMAIKGYLYVLSPNHSKNEQAVAILPTDYHYHSAVRGVPGPISRGSKHVYAALVNWPQAHRPVLFPCLTLPKFIRI